MEGHHTGLDSGDERFDAIAEDNGDQAKMPDESAPELEDAFAGAQDWNDIRATALDMGSAGDGDDAQSGRISRPKGRLRHLRGRPPLVIRVSVVVMACAVIGGLIGAAVYHLRSDAPAHTAKTLTAPPHTLPVITLLSPSGTTAQGTGSAATVAPLPTTNVPAPSQFLAPDKPSAYELSLIAASGSPEKAIVVSRDSQTIHVYQSGQFIAGSYAITGRPQLPTPVGVYQIFLKEGPVVLYSPWPPSSPFYYTPEPVNYVMEFRAGGFLIHDAPWHHVWGPGMNDWHYDPVAKEWQWGTHGCVTAPTPFIQWLYNWSPYGTTVIVY